MAPSADKESLGGLPKVWAACGSVLRMKSRLDTVTSLPSQLIYRRDRQRVNEQCSAAAEGRAGFQVAKRQNGTDSPTRSPRFMTTIGTGMSFAKQGSH